MEIKFNTTDRKALVMAIAEITGEKAQYKGMPSAAYEIGNLTVTRECKLEMGETQMEDVKELLTQLEEKGFKAEVGLEIEKELEEPTGTAIQIPLSGFNETQLQNLYSIVEAKGCLIKKALQVEELPIYIIENRIDFPWFPKDYSPEELNAYLHLVTAICDMAKKQKRITAKPRADENEKYAFRCFLLRLGFIGDEYKTDRKILLQHLDGSSAFKSGKDKGDANEISE